MVVESARSPAWAWLSGIPYICLEVVKSLDGDRIATKLMDSLELGVTVHESLSARTWGVCCGRQKGTETSKRDGIVNVNVRSNGLN